MKVLIGCEESGVVRDAFARRGHIAWSCDFLPTRIYGRHWQGDVVEALTLRKWDLIILHPPCDFLTVAGNRWYGEGTEGHQKRIDSIKWTEELWTAAKATGAKVAMENPVGVLSGSDLGKPSQYIHPWQFGHGETKKTCLWLHGLPQLKPTNIVEGREQRIWKMAPGPNRKRDRSETYQGWADAMAEQWGQTNLRPLNNSATYPR